MLVGVDFTSRPTRRKSIVMACGARDGDLVQLQSLRCFESLDAFAAWLAEPGDWIAALDLPFGLPRELVQHLGWPTDWLACMRHYASRSRVEIRECFAAFCAARPAGGKFAHRATDGPAGSSPSRKWVNPPVAFMLHAGVPPLIAAGGHLPGLHDGDRRRVALEGYPGLLARACIGRASYKSDEPKRQTPERLAARRQMLEVLQRGAPRLGLRLVVAADQRALLARDASGDRLDAVLCLMQAAWAERAHAAGDMRYGLPKRLDPLEGWIVTAPESAAR